MNVLFVSAEVDPFAKVGGLADVIGSLPIALRKHDIDARIIMPYYGMLDSAKYNFQWVGGFEFPRRHETVYVEIFSTVHQGVTIYFLKGHPFFGQENSVYVNYDWDISRFIFFCEAVMQAVEFIDQKASWFPDVIHVNDWHTGLIPFFIAQRRGIDARWAHIGSIVGIHNIAYQGQSVGSWLYDLGIPTRHHPELLQRGLGDNMLAISIAYSDIVTTVSPRYATEIQYPYAGYGLDDLIRSRVDDLYGILNGIDTDLWNPATDPKVKVHFDAETFEEKRVANKLQLQQDVGLQPRADVPLIGMVTRLVWQKGIDLALPALRVLLASEDVQFIGLGSGEEAYNYGLGQLGNDFNWKARSYIGYNAAVAQQIYASCDIFLMPSHYEPCGVGQMLAMRYGALPLVRETGGLADTVQNFDNNTGDHGTGFVFQWEDWEAVLGTLRWATHTYRSNREAWMKMQKRAMLTDFSWKRSALAYIELYEKVQARHQD